MFRTSYVHHQEDYIVHAALYVVYACSLSGWRMFDEHKMFETC